jgi:hypothetical protein
MTASLREAATMALDEWNKNKAALPRWLECAIEKSFEPLIAALAAPEAEPVYQDAAALIEIDRVMLESGAHWPDVETDAMVVRHVKQLTRMMNETAAQQAALRDQVRLAYMSGTDDFRRFYDAELFAVIGVAGFRELYAPSGSTAAQPAQVVAVIGFYKDEREPRLLSWDRLPDGEHRLYAAPQPGPYDQTALALCGECGWKTLIPGECCLNCDHNKAAPVERKPLTEAQIDDLLWNRQLEGFDLVRGVEGLHNIKAAP